jgi:diguanylate cyclase
MQAAEISTNDKRQAVLVEMRKLGLPLTAQNFAVWREFRTAGDERLSRAINIVLSNGRVPDQVMLHRLYTQYCASRQETAALKDVARRALVTLDLIPGLLGDIKDAATDYHQSLHAASNQMGDTTIPLRPLVLRLAAETQEMIHHSEALVERLNQSSERIGELEQFLDAARQEAATDKLTGLANRRAFDAALTAEAGSAMNNDRPLALLIADVDHFKSVNDKWGHDVGDDVLRMVAGAMSESVRGRDLVARYGGEEFGVILPDTPEVGAMAVAENLRAAVAACSVPMERCDTELAVTISIGASVYDVGEKLSTLVARADAALYQAKRGGRNRAAFS